MSINITGTLVPASSTFGIANSSDLVGGDSQYANEAAIGAINAARLLVGQKAYSQSTAIEYILTSLTPSGGFANGTWTTSLTPSGGSWTAAQLVSTSNLTLSGEQTIDGVLTNGSRVLITGQTTQAQNGIYVTAAGAWTRATDANSSGAFVVGKTIAITGGSSLAGSIWVYNGAASPTIGTTAITFAENANSGATVNLSSPPPIGDVAPNTVAATALTVASIAFRSGNAPSLQENAVTSGGDADYKLVASEYTAGHITFHSIALTADRLRGVPATPGAAWEFENNTTGGHNIIVKVADGSGYYGNGIVVPPGKTVRGAVSTDLTDILTVGGGGSNSIDSTLHSASFTATAGNDYKVDTTSVAVTVTLPSSPTEGDVIGIADANPSGSFGTNSCTVAAAGSGITVQDWVSMSTGATTVLNRNGQSVRFKYFGGTSKFWSLIG